ncbi:MAG: HesA/MoeB/ThiF family protein [Muribaculaceae bacterium]|nr:HesA/MoeB/ThiF family protein [Muribaculaceae bacterium]
MATDEFELSKEQRLRYSRNIMLPEIGRKGQQQLLRSKVLIVGTGALGSIAAMYLAGSGVGEITIADYDTIDISNLQRQLSFSTEDCGKLKVLATKERLLSINPEIRVNVIDKMLTRNNAQDLISSHHLVIEGSDNPSTKYLISDLCKLTEVPCVLGGVAQFNGQVSSWCPGYPTYRDIFPEQATEGGYTPCSIGGVLGPLPGIVASWQAAEAIKILTGIGTPLFGRMLIIDALAASSTVITL